MKLFFISVFATIIIALTPAVYAKAPQSVDFVDAKKFSGLWYEISRTYNSFEKDCVASTVEYTFIEPLKYDIKNRCFDTTMEGKLIEYNGTAKPSNGSSMTKIDMTYFWLFTREYRIVYLNKEYTTAVLVDKDMEYVWIMNRKPFMKEDKLNNIVAFLGKYMDTSELIYTPHDKQGRYK